MYLLNNPFYILGADFDDNQDTLSWKAEDVSLVNEKAFDALFTLGHPKRRLEAEINWLLGLSKAECAYYISIFERDEVTFEELLDLNDLPPLPACHLLAAWVKKTSDISVEQLLEIGLIRLPAIFDRLNADDLYKSINIHRIAAGFPEVNQVSHVIDELNKLKRYYVGILGQALTLRPTLEVIDLYKRMLKESTQNGKQYPPEIVNDLGNLYRTETIHFRQEQLQVITKLLKRIKFIVKNKTLGEEETKIYRFTAELEPVIRDWFLVVTPLYQLAAANDMPDDSISRISYDILNISFYLGRDPNFILADIYIHRLLFEMLPPSDKLFAHTSSNLRILNRNLPFSQKIFKLYAFKFVIDSPLPKYMDKQADTKYIGFAGTAGLIAELSPWWYSPLDPANIDPVDDDVDDDSFDDEPMSEAECFAIIGLLLSIFVIFGLAITSMDRRSMLHKQSIKAAQEVAFLEERNTAIRERMDEIMARPLFGAVEDLYPELYERVRQELESTSGLYDLKFDDLDITGNLE